MEQRLGQKIKISENQFGFMHLRSTREAIFSPRQLMKKSWDNAKNLHMTFINLEKIYDKVTRD